MEFKVKSYNATSVHTRSSRAKDIDWESLKHGHKDVKQIQMSCRTTLKTSRAFACKGHFVINAPKMLSGILNIVISF